MSGSEGRTFKPIHRMVGAVVLVVLAVILLPMIFRPRPQTMVTVAPLGKSRPPVVSPLVHSGTVQALSSAAPVTATSTASAPAPAAVPLPPVTPSAPTVPVVQAPAPVPVKQVAVPAPSQKVLRTRVAPPARGWFVQVAAFSQERAAIILAHRFALHGFPAHVERERIRGRTYFRTRLGPYRDRPDALRAQRQIVTVWPRGRTLLVYSRR